MQTSTSSHEILSAQPSRFSQRIGSTTYRVSMFFPGENAGTESLESKILRLIKNDLIYQPDNGTMGLLQTSPVAEGGSL